MRFLDMPFEKAEIKRDDFLSITKEIEDQFRLEPNKPLSIQEISEKSKVHPNIVKKAFYLLLSNRALKATFIPKHHNCNIVIGNSFDSVAQIYERIEEGEIRWCNICQEPIEDATDVEIGIVFWKPGTNV